MSAKYICDFCKQEKDVRELTRIRITIEPTNKTRPRVCKVDADACEECYKDIFNYIYNKIGVDMG